MRSFVCVLISLDVQMFLSMLNATLTLPIIAATSTSVPPITLPRYVKEHRWMLCRVALRKVSPSKGNQGTTRGGHHRGQKIFSLPRVVPWFPLLGLTPSGLFMGSSSTLIYTSGLILCFTICVLSATGHNIHMYPYFLFAAIHHPNRPRLSLSDLIAQ